MNDVATASVASEVVQLQAKWPALQLAEESAGLVVSGPVRLELDLADGAIDGTFELRMLVPRGFPREVPKVWEVSRSLDPAFRHFLDDGSLCLGVHADLLLRLKERPRLASFFEEAVIPYLANYLHWKRRGAVLTGERSHGSAGVREFFLEYFRCGDTGLVFFLRCLAHGYRSSQRCPCASGLAIGKCHGEHLRKLASVRASSYFAQLLAEMTKGMSKGTRKVMRKKR